MLFGILLNDAHAKAHAFTQHLNSEGCLGILYGVNLLMHSHKHYGWSIGKH